MPDTVPRASPRASAMSIDPETLAPAASSCNPLSASVSSLGAQREVGAHRPGEARIGDHGGDASGRLHESGIVTST